MKETRGLSTCDLSDALDGLGIEGAVRGILPLWPGCRRIAGLAATLKLVAPGGASPVEGTLRAIAAARRGDILVIDHGGHLDVNSFGGIAGYTARKRGLAGVVIDGVTRDVDQIRRLGLPAFAHGVIQQSVRGRCSYGGHDIEVTLGGIRVAPGDLVMADDNGVIVVPRARIDEALSAARLRVATERRVIALIARGADPVTAHEKARYEGRPAARGKPRA